MWFAFPPAGLWPLVCVAPALLALAAATIAGTRGGRRCMLYAVVWLVCAIKWWCLNAWMMQVTPVGLHMLSLYGAAFDVLAVWLMLRCRRVVGARVPHALLLPLAFCGPECVRALVLFDGYPWFRLGHPLVSMPVLVQVCDLAGEVVASLLVACMTGALVDAWQALARRSEPRTPEWGTRCPWPGVALAGAAVAAAFLYGAFRLGEAPQGAGPGVLAIQTNLATSNKVAWSPEDQVLDGTRFAELTLEAGVAALRQGKAIALAAWPETTLGGYGLEPDQLMMLEEGGYFPGLRFQRLAAGVSARMGVPLLVGSPCFVGMREYEDRWVWDAQYNSAYLVGAHPAPYPRYDKIFLAPFGETMPYIRAWPALQERLLAIGARGMHFDLHAGAGPVQFRVPWMQGGDAARDVRVAVPICYEDAMSWVCRDLVFPPSSDGRVRAADLMVNITNDGWFGWFDGGRAQHVQLARFRCIETRTPMVRVANTGMCVGIDSSGRITAPPPAPRTAAWLYANPPLDERVPLCVRIGDGVSWLIMGICALLSLASFVRPRGGRAMLAPLGGVACAVMALVWTGGCTGNQQAVQEQPWSSRDQSTQPTGKAKLSDGPPPSGPGIPLASSGGGTQSTAAALLCAASRSAVPVYRAHAAEALGASPEDLRTVARALLADPNRGVRFVAAMSVGRSGLAECEDSVRPLLVDDSPSVRAAAIYALTKFGQRVDQTPLAAMAMSEDPEVRANAYVVLGELGNASALPLIRQSLGRRMRGTNAARDRITDLQAAEAMVRLGDVDQLEPIRAALFAPTEQGELTALAIQIAGRLRDAGCRPMLIRLIDASGDSARAPEIRLTAAASLAEFSPQDAGQIALLSKAYIRDRDPVVRGQAALALARAQRAAAMPELERMLFDPDASVQLAAAKAALIATRPR